jgi:hypothetical protein
MSSLTITFDPTPHLDSLDTDRRRLLFLDQSYWLDLVDAPTSDWIELREALNAEVEGGRLLVPVTSWNLMEAAKLRNEQQLTSLSEIMNTLSRNVVFVDSGVRLRREISYFIRNHRAGVTVAQRRRRHALSVWPAMSGELSLESHPSEEGRAIAEAIAPEVFEEMTRQGIRLVEPTMGGYPEWLKEGDVKYEEGMARIPRGLPPGAHAFRDQVEEEAAFLLLNSGFSASELEHEIGSELMASFIATYPTDATKRDAYLVACPTLYASAHIHAAYRQHGGPYRASDFFDISNLVLAVPYADLVTFDAHATHIARNRLKLDERFGCQFLTGPGSILAAIRDSPGTGA